MLLGANGQLGHSLSKRYRNDHFEVTALTKKQCDTTDFNQVEEQIQKKKYDCIINASAYTKVDDAEENVESSDMVNCQAIKNICKIIKNTKILLIHYSTDYVFDGTSKIPYTESDNTNPLNQYGKSKLNGEKVIHSYSINNLIFRTSWVYDDTSQNFPNKILDKIKKGEVINVVDDQYGVPNHVDFISEVTYKCIEKYFSYSDDIKNSINGIYHLSSTGEVSWYKYAEFIFQKYSEKEMCEVNTTLVPIKSSSIDCRAVRPNYSVLDSSKISSVFDIVMPPWQDYANKFIDSKL